MKRNVPVREELGRKSIIGRSMSWTPPGQQEGVVVKVLRQSPRTGDCSIIIESVSPGNVSCWKVGVEVIVKRYELKELP